MTSGGPVVVNGRFLAGVPTGLHRVGRSLLAAAEGAGLETEVLTPPAPGEPPVAGTRLSRRLGGQAWEQTVLPRLARGRRVLSLCNTAPLAARRGVVMVHDLAPLVGPEWFVPSMRAYGRLVLAGARRAELVLTVSAQVADELTGRGVRAPVEVVRQAVDDVGAAPDPADVAAALGRLGVVPPYTLLVGWADPRKDAVTAVAAHLRAARSRPHTLVLVGLAHPVFAPVELPELPSVRRLGWVADADLAALLAGAAAVLAPSRYEGWGRPALEAWRLGTPALVSDLPAVREATLGRATYLTPGDVDAWAEATVAALDGGITVPEPDPWTWADAGRRLVDLLG